MKRLCIPLVCSVFFFLTGCVEKSGYYEEGEDNIISLICDVVWIGEKVVYDTEETAQDIYRFRRDGTCTRTIVVTGKDGEESQSEIYYRWAFYNQSSNTIYFGEDHYWDIEELTTAKFAVYDRWGEYGSLDMSREYREFTPLK